MKNKPFRPHLSQTETLLQKMWKDITVGVKPQIKCDECITGRITPALKTKLTKKINLLIKDCQSFKIGKTGDAYIRCDKKDYRDVFSEMHLLYKSKSESNVSNLEEEYIEKYFFHSQTQNKRIKSPGKTMSTYDGYYCLYIIINT